MQHPLAGRGPAILLMCLALGVAASACTTDDKPPVKASAVNVSSNIDTIVAVGHSAQLSAAARAANGDDMEAVFSWSSGNTAVASVSGNGLVEGQSAGRSLITASIVTDPAIQGSLQIRVVAADLNAVGGLISDPLLLALVNALTPEQRTAIDGAWDRCAASAGNGNIAAILKCLTDIRNANAADQGDRAVLAVLGLFADAVERKLALT